MVDGSNRICSIAPSISRTASPRGKPSSQIKRDRYRRKLALMIHLQRRGFALEVGECTDRYLHSARRSYVELLDGVGALLKTRIHFHYDVILVQREYIVDTCRWQKASYNVLSITCCAEFPAVTPYRGR